jgi:hypothetical protein
MFQKSSYKNKPTTLWQKSFKLLYNESQHNILAFMVCTLNNSVFGITGVVFRGISKFGIIYVEILLKIVERIYLIIYNIYKIKFKNLKIKYHHFITRWTFKMIQHFQSWFIKSVMNFYYIINMCEMLIFSP